MSSAPGLLGGSPPLGLAGLPPLKADKAADICDAWLELADVVDMNGDDIRPMPLAGLKPMQPPERNEEMESAIATASTAAGTGNADEMKAWMAASKAAQELPELEE